MKHHLVLPSLSLLFACTDMAGGDMVSSLGESDLGATPGGQQDIGAARQMLDQGVLPGAEMLTYQGIFSEHDLGFANPEPCLAGQTLCVEALAGSVDLIAVGDEGVSETLVQIGFDTGIAQPFVRKPLNLSLSVDVSGSMGGDRIAAVRDALRTLVGSLRDDDTFSLVAFNSEARQIIAPTAGSEKAQLREAIDELQAGGGTNIGAGLDQSFALVRDNLTEANRQTHLHRVMLFTDMHPNRGMQDGRTFVRVLEDAADEGIGVSSFGVGIDFGADLANQVSQVRGGNYFHLETPDKVRQVFDRDFDLMVTPLAFDLQISLQAPAGYSIVDAYGLVGGGSERCGDQPVSRCIGMTVPTVFLSRGGGGIFLLLALDGEPQEGDPDFIGYITYNDDQGAGVEQESAISLAPDLVPEADATDAAIRMGAQLINVIDALKDLSATRGGNEAMTWAVIRALRQEALAMGSRADSLLRELILLNQAIEVARQLN